MPPHDEVPPHLTADSPLPYQLVNELFAAGLDVHRALRCLDHGLDPDRCLQSALVRIDTIVATVLRSALRRTGTAATTEEQLVSGTFAALADGLAGESDLADQLLVLALHGTDLPDVGAAAFIVGEAGGTPHLAVTVPDRPGLQALCHLRPSPTWDTYASGRPHTVTDLTTDIRWPLFAARACAAGHRAVHTIPVRRRETALGALALFLATPGALPPHDVRIAQLLGNLAALSVLVHAGHDIDRITDAARIHQATGILAERLHIPVSDAFAITTHTPGSPSTAEPDT